jgi:hypothetical protein
MDRRVAPAAAIVVMTGQKARSAVFAPAVLLAAVRDGSRGPDPESRYLHNIFFWIPGSLATLAPRNDFRKD